MRVKKHCPIHPYVPLDPLYFRNSKRKYIRYGNIYACNPPTGRPHLVNGNDAHTPTLRYPIDYTVLNRALKRDPLTEPILI